MVHKNEHIELKVKDIRRETAGYLSVVFERPRGFTYEAGDWMDIQFAASDLRGGKTYSFASSPSEPDIAIVFREGISPFKTALASAQLGEKLHITQYGNDYDFHLRQNKSIVLLAGGVGIAPFRSMLKEMTDNYDGNTVNLIYFNQSENFLFQPELEEWQSKLQNLNISYIVTKELKRKEREATLRPLITNPNQQFYIAGPPKMAVSTSQFLQGIGVEKNNIKIDAFEGY